MYGGIADRQYLLTDTQGVTGEDVEAEGDEWNQQQTAHVVLPVIQKPESGWTK
jgi:hypothetical protein